MTLFSSSQPTSQYYIFQNVVASNIEKPPNLGVGDPVCSWIACVFPKDKKSRTFSQIRVILKRHACPAPTLMAKSPNKTCCLTRQSSNKTSHCIRRKLIKTSTQRRRRIIRCDYLVVTRTLTTGYPVVSFADVFQDVTQRTFRESVA